MDKQTRNLIQKATQDARNLLESEFGEQIEGVFDILPDGHIAPSPGGHLTAEQHIIRQKIVAAIEHERAGGVSNAEAVGSYLRMASFTYMNRFVALKMLEARGLVQECVSRGEQSSGFKEFCGLAPGLGEFTDKGYRLYIESLFDELSTEIRVLFDRRDLSSLVWPRQKALEGLLGVLNREEIANLWAEDETIGWVYQYFNLKEERDAMRKASRSPRNTRELAVRNQFFTPRYVVEFLTDNTLGQIWYEMRKGNTALKGQCRYLVRRPNEVFLEEGEKIPQPEKQDDDLSKEEVLRQPVYIPHRPLKDPRDIKMLDPACGSMHFGLYAFDLFERIYDEAWDLEESLGPGAFIRSDGLKPLHECYENKEAFLRDVPRLIIEWNIHGIDIDPRAVQIASLSLWLRAQRSWKNLGVKASERPRIAKSNIVTAEPMPGEKDMMQEFVGGLKPRVLGQLVDVVFDKMKLAGEAGSLLMIQEEIKDALAEAKRQWLEAPKPEQQFLFSGMSDSRPKQQELRFDFSGVTNEQFWAQAEERILEALKRYSERAENGLTVRRRLFTEDAAHGFAFIDICSKRYDAILMNPPFGASSRASKEYIDDRYPSTKGDILTNFVERALHLVDEQGRIGAISSRTPFFLGSMESFRKEVIGKTGHVRLLADLGEGVLEAMVETAVYVLTKTRKGEPESIFFRLLIDAEKGDILQELVADCFGGHVAQRTFIINPADFDALSGKPYAYWVSGLTIKALADHPCIEGTKGAIRVGMQTGDDFRFLRCLWEVNPRLISPSPRSTASAESPRQRCLMELSTDRTWVPFSKTETASPWFSPLTLVTKWAANGSELRNFTNEAGKLRSALRSEQEYFKPGFSYMLRSTRLVPYLVPSGVIPTAGRAQIFPEQGQEYSVLAICASNVGSAVARFSGEKFAWPKFQASMVQGLPACDFPEDTLARIKDYVDAQVNNRRAVVQRYEPFQEFTLPAWFQSSGGGETTWDLYSLFGRGLETEIAAAVGLISDQLTELERDIREAVSIRGSSGDNNFDDADGETSDDELEQELNVELIVESPEEKAVGLFMYLVGTSFGRWDLRMALNPSLAPKLPDPFDPLPVCPPGMLVGPNGLPAESGCIASEDWLRARPEANRLPPESSAKTPTVPDTDYPLRISWEGGIVDDPGWGGGQPHREDIVRRVREVLNLLWKDKAHEIEQEACDILSITDLRAYFRKDFFADHIKRYSKSRRKAPIYWQLSTPSVSYSVWLYYHRFTKDTMYQVLNDFVAPKLQFEERELANARQGYGPSPTAIQRNEITAREAFVAELRTFKEEVARVAPLWNPDLNDGVIINFAPFWRLVPQNRSWQKECKACWDKLVAGDYDWAHLAMHLWPERVVPKCAKDRSLAIAHALEDAFWEEDKNGKWVPKKVPKEAVEVLIKERTSPTVKAALDELLKAPVSNGTVGRKGKKKA